MPVALKKDQMIVDDQKKKQDIAEINRFLKKQTKLKNTTAIVSTLASNDNARLRALAGFTAKRALPKDKIAPQVAEKADAKIIAMQAMQEVAVDAIKTIQEQDLSKTQAIQFLKDAEATVTLDAFANSKAYTTPALKNIRREVEHEADAHANLLKASEQDIRIQAMSAAVEASQETDITAAAAQIQKASFADKNADEAVSSYRDLDQNNEAVQDLNVALETLGGDGTPPHQVLENSLKGDKELFAEQSTTVVEANKNRERVYIEYKGKYYNQGDTKAQTVSQEVVTEKINQAKISASDVTTPRVIKEANQQVLGTKARLVAKKDGVNSFHEIKGPMPAGPSFSMS